MNIMRHEDFGEILNKIKERVEDNVYCGEIKAIESNFDTKGMMFKANNGEGEDGTVIVGEDNGYIAIDISLSDGSVRSFKIKNIEDKEGIKNIIGWFNKNYNS